MLIYNVTVKVEHEIHEEWFNWMKTIHIPDVMATACFVKNAIYRIQTDETDGISYAIQYFCENEKALNDYQQKFAHQLQKEHLERYQDKFVAFRTLLEEV